MLKKILVYSILCLIFSCVVLPSGSINRINIKLLLLMIVILFSVIDYIFLPYLNKYLILLVGLFYALLFFAFFRTLINGFNYTSAFSQLNTFTSVIVLVFFPLHIIYKKYISYQYLLQKIIIFSLIYCLIKMIFELIYLSGYLGAAEIAILIESIFGIAPISLEFSGLLRLNLPSDFLIPILFFTVSARQYFSLNLNKFMIYSCYILFSLSIFIAYSRYLWFLSFFSLLFSFYFLKDHLKAYKNRIRFVILFLCAISIFSLILLRNPDLTQLIFDLLSERYSGDASVDSDADRIIMKTELINILLDFPLFGAGLGAYPQNYIRFPELPWNYELQWLALTMQFGLFGILFICIYLYIILKFSASAKYPVNFFVSCLFLVWIFTGFFNCFLITSSSGVLYLIFILFGLKKFDDKKFLSRNNFVQ